MAGKITRFNNWLANKLGNVLSHMAFFYVCLAMDIIELPPVIAAHSAITWVTYLSQTVIQLLALPILGAQNKLQQDNHTDLKAHIDNHVEDLHAAIAKAGQENQEG